VAALLILIGVILILLGRHDPKVETTMFDPIARSETEKRVEATMLSWQQDNGRFIGHYLLATKHPRRSSRSDSHGTKEPMLAIVVVFPLVLAISLSYSAEQLPIKTYTTTDGLTHNHRLGSPPPILIDGIPIAGVDYQLSSLGESKLSGLEFTSQQNDIRIDFLGLSFAAGERLRYQYMIQDADANRSAMTDQHTVNYSSRFSSVSLAPRWCYRSGPLRLSCW